MKGLHDKTIYRSKDYIRRKENTVHSLGVFVVFLSLLLDNCRQYRRNGNLGQGNYEKGWCNLNPRTHISHLLCHCRKICKQPSKAIRVLEIMMMTSRSRSIMIRDGASDFLPLLQQGDIQNLSSGGFLRLQWNCGLGVKLVEWCFYRAEMEKW